MGQAKLGPEGLALRHTVCVRDRTVPTSAVPRRRPRAQRRTVGPQSRFSAPRPVVPHPGLPQAPLPGPRSTTSGASPGPAHHLGAAGRAPLGAPGRGTGRGGAGRAAGGGGPGRAGPVVLPRSAGTAALRLRPRHGFWLRAALRLPGSLWQVAGRLRPVRTHAHAESDSAQRRASHVYAAPRVARASRGHRSHRTSTCVSTARGDTSVFGGFADIGRIVCDMWV